LLSAILRLAATNIDANVISTPHILATANEEASIIIGEEVPQLASQTVTDGGKTIDSVTRIQIAKELTITPQINAGNYLTLKIKQKVNERGDPDQKGQLSTIKREASTTAIVKDQQTIVIGGLMEDRKDTTVSKVPLLGDIPILGWLFKSRKSEVNKINLLLFITPHIIRDTGDMNDTFFRKLKEREGFLKEIGVSEKKNVPISGLSDEQLKMFDEDYLKSIQQLKLVPLKTISEGETPATEEMPVAPVPAPAPAPAKPEKAKPEVVQPTAPASPEPLRLEDTPPEENTPPQVPVKAKTI
jgi:general secretion pathway protein D